MIKILEMFGEPITYGGQESVVYNMLSTFDLKNTFNVDLFTPYYADNKLLLDLINGNNGKVFTANIEFKTGDNRFLLYKPLLKFANMLGTYNVIHIHSGSLASMYILSKIAKKLGAKKVIVHAHTTGFTNSASYRIRRYLICKLMRRYIDTAIGCSENAFLSKFAHFYDDIKYIVHNGINVDRFKFNKVYRQEIREKYALKNKFVVGSIGRISSVKNNKFMLDILSNVIKKIPNSVLLMIGDGEDLENIKKYAADLKLSDYVVFAGKQIDTYKFYSAFDVYIQPSIYEGISMTSIEAQISGRYCLLSSNIDIESNISSNTIFLDINDAKVWADKLCNIFTILNIEKSDTIDFDKYDMIRCYNSICKLYIE